MKAAVYYDVDDVRVEELPVPEPGPDDVLVRTRAVGLCGSDVEREYRNPRVAESVAKHGRGLVLGHELAGTVASPGANVSGWREGDRVVVTHHVPCFECHYCRDGLETACDTLRSTNVDPGGLAEYMRLPAANVRHGMLRLPDHVTFEQAACVEPLGCVLRGQRNIELAKHDVLVVGAGLSGVLHVKLARARGARRVLVTDVDEFRLRKAREFGADDALNTAGAGADEVVDWVRGLTGRGVQRAIVCAGAPAAAEQAWRSLDRGGRLLSFAVPHGKLGFELDLARWREGARFETTYGAAPRDMCEALELIASRRVVVDDMITHRLPLDRAQEGFQLTAQPRDSLKVVIEM